MRRHLGVILAVAVTVLAAGVGHADPRRSPAPFKLGDARIVLFAPSVAVYELGAGGQMALKQDWTDAAPGHVLNAIEAALAAGKATVVPSQPPEVAGRPAAPMQVTEAHTHHPPTNLRHGSDGANVPR